MTLSFILYKIIADIYVLEDKGKRSCTAGSSILDVAECEKACDVLGIPLSGKKFKERRKCYKGGSQVCNQNGGHGSNSHLICKK